VKWVQIADRPANYVLQISLSAAAKISEKPRIASKLQEFLLNYVCRTEISSSYYGSPQGL
jgi:hypothetical protein